MAGKTYVVTPANVFGALNAILFVPSLSTKFSRNESIPSSLVQYLDAPKNLLPPEVPSKPIKKSYLSVENPGSPAFSAGSPAYVPRLNWITAAAI